MSLILNKLLFHFTQAIKMMLYNLSLIFKKKQKFLLEFFKMKNKTEITIYGTRWCGDTKRACRLLDDYRIKYQFIDIDQDKKGEAFVREINSGARSVPTIIFSDGSVLVEPDERTLGKKLGIF
jgi:mycoredoxin